MQEITIDTDNLILVQRGLDKILRENLINPNSFVLTGFLYEAETNLYQGHYRITRDNSMGMFYATEISLKSAIKDLQNEH